MNRRDLIRTAFLAMFAPAVPMLGPIGETDKERRLRKFNEWLATPDGKRQMAIAMYETARKARRELYQRVGDDIQRKREAGLLERPNLPGRFA